jgi:hypothetical protein
MECEIVRRAISDGDGRVLRGRGIGAHLRGCAGCRDFRALIDTRTADLRMLVPPLPSSAAAAILARLLAHGTGGGHAGAAAAASGTALGNHATASLIVKGLVGVTVMAATTAGTFHLVRGLTEHKHRSSALASVADVRGGAVDRAGLAHGNAGPTAVALAPGTRSIAAARVVRSHISPGHGTLVSTGIQSEASHPLQSPAIAAAGHGKSSSHHINGSATGIAHRTSSARSRGSNKGQLAPRGPKRSHRSVGPSTSSPSQGPSHSEKSPKPSRESGGSGHTPQAHKAPVGQPPAGGEKGNEAHEPTTAPGTPPATAHGHSGK